MQEPIESPPPLAFDKVLVIVGGGEVDTHVLHALAARGAHLVGADSGGDVIRDAGLVPEAIIGDFDSLRDPSDWDARTRLMRIAEQETTDFEKALYSTTAPVTIALGMTGMRLDHTLAAIDVIARHAQRRTIMLVDADDVAVALNHAFDFTVEARARVSVHPLSPVRFIRSTGLRYRLDGLTLAPGLRTGTSNEASAVSFSIEPADDGVWLLILEQRWLETLIDR